MKRNRFLKATVCLVSLSWLISCQSIKNPYGLMVVQNQQPIKTFTIEMIQKLPAKSFIMDGKLESGPTVASLLENAGIKDFVEISIKNGSGESFQTKTPEKFILDITNRGTVKLASEELSKEKWLKDVTEIEIIGRP
jgi:hypothetical protein